MGKYTIQVTEKLEQRYKELRSSDMLLLVRYLLMLSLKWENLLY